MKKLTLKDLIDNTSIPAPLVRAVIKQFGDFEAFENSADDVVNHGIDGGFSGFIYHTDTVKFTRKNKRHILEYAGQLADDCGEGSAVRLIANFNCLRKYPDMKPDRIAELLYRPFKEDENGDTTAIFNTLAGFACEEVCQAWVDLKEQQDG